MTFLQIYFLVVGAFIFGILFGWHHHPLNALLRNALDEAGVFKPRQPAKMVDIPTEELVKRMEEIESERSRLVRDANYHNLAIKQWFRDVEAVLDLRDKSLQYNSELKKIEIL